jgi:hypothetical protein
MGSGMENPDLPLPLIYRRLFHVPKGSGKLGQGFTVIHKTSFFAHKMDSL